MCTILLSFDKNNKKYLDYLTCSTTLDAAAPAADDAGTRTAAAAVASFAAPCAGCGVVPCVVVTDLTAAAPETVPNFAVAATADDAGSGAAAVAPFAELGLVVVAVALTWKDIHTCYFGSLVRKTSGKSKIFRTSSSSFISGVATSLGLSDSMAAPSCSEIQSRIHRIRYQKEGQNASKVNFL